MSVLPEKILALACREWCQALANRNGARWITIIGDETGSATRLFLWAKKKFDWSGFSYIPHGVYWPELVDQIHAGEAVAKRDEMKQWPVLFLDELRAAQNPRGLSSEELNTLLGCRMGRWTILTVKTQDEFEKMDPRITARLVKLPNVVCR